jgi:Domain of unknown function (4846)
LILSTRLKLVFLLPFIAISCGQVQKESPPKLLKPSIPGVYKKIGDIPVPEGFERVKADSGSFAGWLRTVPLKKDKTVYLYNGSLKRNQNAQFAVVDIPVGNKDLQQCADAVMRFRADYLYFEKRFSEIAFMDDNHKWYRWSQASDRPAFDLYLQNVYAWCGSASLEMQLKQVNDFNNIRAGDVLVMGGYPGHAMIAVDIAQNDKGKKIFMLAQSYQPAQDIHIVVNPMDEKLSPWYEVNDNEEIITPEWRFKKSNLKTW